MHSIKHRGIAGEIRYSDEDKCWHGKLLGINDLVTYEAESPEQLEEEFKIAVDDYLDT